MVDSAKDDHRPNLDTDADVITVEAAAQMLGIEAKRLLGFIARNGLNDPIGNERYVYKWSLERLRKRLADQPVGPQP